MTSGACTTDPPEENARPWWPRQTPSTGISAASIASRQIPKSAVRSGRPGPGEITMLSNRSPASSLHVAPSLRTTTGSSPFVSASSWNRLNVNES